jgi:nicotinate-nucleotide pyrophosphorylase (carboxylating)
MSLTPAESAACEHLVRLAFAEDLGEVGDRTSQALLSRDLVGQATFVARSAGVIAGLPIVRLICARVDPPLHFQEFVSDGTPVQPGTLVGTVFGSMICLLSAERTALNFLQRLSGVATQTAVYVAEVAGLSCKILDTRKTTPGWRLLEKYAVRMGGGHNHRMGLYDGILIKDNHLAALGGGPEAVSRAGRLAREKCGTSIPVEIEVDTLEQLDAALAISPDMVLLDNMSTEQLRECVRRRNARAPRVLLEASGGITLANLRRVAETGVDRISVGALTHSARALDIALDIEITKGEVSQP